MKKVDEKKSKINHQRKSRRGGKRPGTGGARPNSGRKPGTKNKVNKKDIEELFPDFVGAILAGLHSKKLSYRLKAAQIIAPYVAQKQPESIQHSGSVTLEEFIQSLPEK